MIVPNNVVTSPKCLEIGCDGTLFLGRGKLMLFRGESVFL
jgi:hypothetical protein